MSEQSMSAYFRQELEEGKTPTDPFEAATERVSKDPTEEEKEAMRKEWNLRILKNHAARVKNQQKMLGRRAARALIRHR